MRKEVYGRDAPQHVENFVMREKQSDQENIPNDISDGPAATELSGEQVLIFFSY